MYSIMSLWICTEDTNPISYHSKGTSTKENEPVIQKEQNIQSHTSQAIGFWTEEGVGSFAKRQI